MKKPGSRARMTERLGLTQDAFFKLIAERLLLKLGLSDSTSLCDNMINWGEKQRAERWMEIRKHIDLPDLKYLNKKSLRFRKA